jgi:hypothetical protein
VIPDASPCGPPLVLCGSVTRLPCLMAGLRCRVQMLVQMHEHHTRSDRSYWVEVDFR